MNLPNPFFEQPVLNSPYECPSRHWELDESGQPTQKIIDSRRQAEFITPIPKPRKRKGSSVQATLLFDEGKGLSTEKQQYEHTAICEQVIGRALRRQSYDLNEDGLFNVEYADVLGIPFDFTAKPVVVAPKPPRETIHVKAVRPERDALEIRFPRVAGYRVELPEERLSAKFNENSVLELTPDLVGPSRTTVEGIIGEGVDLNLIHTDDLRRSTLLFHLTQRLLYTKWRDPGDEPKLHLFGQLKRITKQWLDGCLVCKGDTYPAQLMYQELADMACERITDAIRDRQSSCQGRIRSVQPAWFHNPRQCFATPSPIPALPFFDSSLKERCSHVRLARLQSSGGSSQSLGNGLICSAEPGRQRGSTLECEIIVDHEAARH